MSPVSLIYWQFFSICIVIDWQLPVISNTRMNRTRPLWVLLYLLGADVYIAVQKRSSLPFYGLDSFVTANNQLFIYLVIRYMDKFCITQKMPTHKSATARLARKKFVIDRSRRDNVTTRITSKLPAEEISKGIRRKCHLLKVHLIVISLLWLWYRDYWTENNNKKLILNLISGAYQ